MAQKMEEKTGFWTIDFGNEVDTRGSDINLKGPCQRRTIQT